MSADGPGLFDYDTGVDVRSEFTELLGDLRDPVAATSALLTGWNDFIARRRRVRILAFAGRGPVAVGLRRDHDVQGTILCTKQ